MDGINPTLAFAALFLGLSGHPRDAAEQPAQPEHTKAWEAPAPTDQQIGYLYDCPGVALSERAPKHFGPLQDHEVALANSVLTLDQDAAAPSSIPDALNDEMYQDQGGCRELAPQP